MDRKLIDYLPPVLTCNADFCALTEAEQSNIEVGWEDCFSTGDLQFCTLIKTENEISRWEKMLDIQPQDADDLKTRKNQILELLNKASAVSLSKLQSLLSASYKEADLFFKLDIEKHILTVCRNDNDIDDPGVPLTTILKQLLVFQRCLSIVTDNVPANLSIKTALYNRHKALKTAQLTHTQLSGFTHEIIRKDATITNGNTDD